MAAWRGWARVVLGLAIVVVRCGSFEATFEDTNAEELGELRADAERTEEGIAA